MGNHDGNERDDNSLSIEARVARMIAEGEVRIDELTDLERLEKVRNNVIVLLGNRFENLPSLEVDGLIVEADFEDLPTKKIATVVQKPSGYFAAKWLGLALPKKAYEEIIIQMILDLRDETNELDLQGKTSERRWKVTLFYLSLIWTLAAIVIAKCGKQFMSIWGAVK